MAKQTGILKLTGTIGNITFYQLGGQFYARQKSSLSRKRVKKDPVFARTRENARVFGSASKMASQVHKALLKTQRSRGLYDALLRAAVLHLREGMLPEMVVLQLQAMCALQVPSAIKEPPVTVLSEKALVPKQEVLVAKRQRVRPVSRKLSRELSALYVAVAGVLENAPVLSLRE